MNFSPRSALFATSLALITSAAAFGIASGAPLDPSIVADPNAAVAAQPVRATKGIADGSYTGASYDAYYGMVQVKANIRGGRLVSVDVLDYPAHKNTSRRINNYALPVLEQEVVGAQSTNVNLVSGATLTSRAYLRSLKSAISKSAG
jgi:uncharacterized protein with FMN-binding domain